MNEERLMDTEEVARYLGVHLKTVMNLIESKQLKASKVGRVWRLRKRDVDEYLERRSNVAEKPKEESG
jgi:excisionase family DNA binding protein